MNLRPTALTFVALSISLLTWAFAFAGIRVALQGYTPGYLILLRFLIASGLPA